MLVLVCISTHLNHNWCIIKKWKEYDTVVNVPQAPQAPFLKSV